MTIIFHANSPDRPPRDWHGDADVCFLASHPLHHIADFSAYSMDMEAIVGSKQEMDSMKRDFNDDEAMARGYTHLWSVIGRGKLNELPYAVWEFYATNNGAPFLGKAIDVDENHCGRGIGTSLMRAVFDAGFDVIPSGTQTAAGAGFLNKVFQQSGSNTVLF